MNYLAAENIERGDPCYLDLEKNLVYKSTINKNNPSGRVDGFSENNAEIGENVLLNSNVSFVNLNQSKYLVVVYRDKDKELKEFFEFFPSLEEAQVFCLRFNERMTIKWNRRYFDIFNTTLISSYTQDKEWMIYYYGK